jgi:hypothetical protein
LEKENLSEQKKFWREKKLTEQKRLFVSKRLEVMSCYFEKEIGQNLGHFYAVT